MYVKVLALSMLSEKTSKRYVEIPRASKKAIMKLVVVKTKQKWWHEKTEIHHAIANGVISEMLFRKKLIVE